MANRQNPAVVVIGAGMTGILCAIKLREAGITNIVLLEAADRVGGTWRANTYPGVACDSPCHTYAYDFAPNAWSTTLPMGNEIQAYFQRVFDAHNLTAITHFNEAVTACHYDDATQQWRVETAKGRYVCDLLFGATGILCKPTKPNYPGMDQFKGAMFHTAEWDHSVKLEGKRIGYIGTGSTACQAIPELIDLPGTDVTVFQRTPQWIVPVSNRAFTEAEKRWTKEHPRLARLRRRLQQWVTAQSTAAITGNGFLARLQHRIATGMVKRNLERSIKDPVLREKLRPNYKFGCKRAIINDTFYPAIQKPNAHLETTPIARFTANGIVTTDGVEHPVDVVVLSTGFDPRAFMRPMPFTGRAGISIEEAWSPKVRAYRSLLVPGFPNFFLMLGPHAPIGNFSITTISEAQIVYLMPLIAKWRAGHLATIEVSEAATEEWNRALKAKMPNTVWATGGCKSWYLDADGEPLSWPDTWSRWVKLMARPNFDDFVRA
jgi:cation diffusion facilitator CzcD-associated flavoprotein CzcO